MQTILQYKYMSEIKRLHRCAAAVANTDNNKHNYIFDINYARCTSGSDINGGFWQKCQQKNK